MLLTGSLAGTVFLYLQNTDLQQQITDLTDINSSLSSNLDSTITIFDVAKTQIADLETTIKGLEEEKDDLRDDLRDEENRNEVFEDQIKDIAGTVGNLDKLSKTDKELLQKYSKVYFLNENYIPERIRDINDKYILSGREPQAFHANALPFLEDLLEDAAREDIELLVVSAYRSFSTQAQLKGQYLQSYGSGANAFSADQGYSEHQLGTTLDFTTPELGGSFTNFGTTEAYTWLLKNAYKHGFVLSYPEDNAFYVYEPWHWRFVGEDLARDLNRADAHFYDWEQRKIDEYLISIFD